MNERKTIDADKALLHMTFAGRRLLIAHVITCIAFIIAIVFFTTQNTQREQQIIDLITKLHCGEQITEVLNGTAPE
jgi:preprotein translocase subunit YajC